MTVEDNCLLASLLSCRSTDPFLPISSLFNRQSIVIFRTHFFSRLWPLQTGAASYYLQQSCAKRVEDQVFSLVVPLLSNNGLRKKRCTQWLQYQHQHSTTSPLPPFILFFEVERSCGVTAIHITWQKKQHFSHCNGVFNSHERETDLGRNAITN